MSKNILVVTGSPRKGGNSDMLADAFIKGAEASGHTVSKFAAAFHNIAGCKACDTCWSKGDPCSCQDDFNTELVPLLEEAEVLVLAMPLYFYGFSTQIKAPLDRMYAYAVPACQKKLKITESVFIICGGDEALASYEGAAETYRQVCKFCEWQDKGILIVPGMMEKGEVANTEWLVKAEALGRNI